MARLRKGVCYRTLDRPYTRVSKYRSKSYIKTNYNARVIKFTMGNAKKKDFEVKLKLKTKSDIQLRDNSMESARITSNRLLEREVGTSNYFFRVSKYPHHILRNNPIASGAGADRFSTGMKKSFGKPIGQAAQFSKGDTIFELKMNKKDLKHGKLALQRASKKLPCQCSVEIIAS